jgi:hypothetical protein
MRVPFTSCAPQASCRCNDRLVLRTERGSGTHRCRRSHIKISPTRPRAWGEWCGADASPPLRPHRTIVHATATSCARRKAPVSGEQILLGRHHCRDRHDMRSTYQRRVDDVNTARTLRRRITEMLWVGHSDPAAVTEGDDRIDRLIGARGRRETAGDRDRARRCRISADHRCDITGTRRRHRWRMPAGQNPSRLPR